MKSGWIFLAVMAGILLECWLLQKYEVARHTLTAIANFAMWIHQYPLIENGIFLAFTAFILYGVFSFFRKLEW